MFVPSKKILDNYADVMVNFGVGFGKGVKKGETVHLSTPIVALPLAKSIYKKLIEKGAIPFINIYDDDFSVLKYELSSDEQLSFSPVKLYKGMIDTYDHTIRLLGDEDPMYLKNCDPKKMMLANKSTKPYMDMREKKENAGKFSWTLCLYGTEGMAKEAGLTIKQYWNEIIKACYLREKDPVAKWKAIVKDQDRIRTKLSNMDVDKIYIKSKTTDLCITLGKDRQWLSGRGANVPSFEVFTSPDCKGTNGYVEFEQPLYSYGNVIEGIRLEFEDGKVIKATATKNEKLLKEIVAQKNMNMIGEFALTDKKHSKISKFMAETLFDENFGGKNGSFHIALGDSYPETYTGDVTTMNKYKKEKLGFNDSVDHKDIISISNRVITVVLGNGKEKVIYKNGSFI